MKQINEILNKKDFKGRKIEEDEQRQIKIKFGQAYPSDLITLQSLYDLIGQEFAIGKKLDLSGYGVEMKWLTPSEQLEEAFEYYPGIAAIKKGFVPIGSCLKGSGDPYFVNVNNDKINVYRIPHNCLNGNDNLDLHLIEMICSLEQFLDWGLTPKIGT